MIYLFWGSLLFLFSVWLIYPALLKLLTLNREIIIEDTDTNFSLPVSVIIAAHNEASNLSKRCENLFQQKYSGEIEVIIASDGSNDETPVIIESLNSRFKRIQFIDIKPQKGRSNAHNQAITIAKHDVLIFTDAETVFEDECISHLVQPFSNKEVGFVSGTLKYFNQDINTVSKSFGLYWRLEMFLRDAESKLGIYATGTGACCAVKKSLYKTIPSTGDVDFITPLDAILSNKKCIHSNSAIAWDELPNSPHKELLARVRMTSKNIKGTLGRWGVLAILNHPLHSISIFFHKIGRWLTPFFLAIFLLSNLVLVSNSYLYLAPLLAQVVFYSLGVLGFLGINFLYSMQIYSFLLANLGFCLGVLRALTGSVPHLYKPIGQQK